MAILGEEGQKILGFLVEVEEGMLEEDLARDQEDEKQEQILWLAMCVGYVAIWPVIFPVMLELLEEPEPPIQYMCNEAQVAIGVEEDELD